MNFGADDRVLLGVGLSDTTAPVVLDAARSAVLLGAAVRTRTVGLLCAAVVRGEIVLDDEQRTRLEQAGRESAAVAVTLERVLLDAASVLDEIGAPFRVLKGAALAHGAYPDPGWRDFGDVDLLIEGRRMSEVVEAFERRGVRRTYDRIGARYERTVGKSVTLVDGDGWELDLHRTIAHGPWGVLVEVDDLWRDRRTFTIGGRDLPTLSPELHLAHALVHIGLGSAVPRWSNLRDVAQLSQHPELDRRSVLTVLDRWQARTPADVAATWSLDATGGDVGWLRSGRRPTTREAAWLALYRQSPQPFRRLTIEAVRAPAGRRRRIEHLVALAPLLRSQRRGGQSVL